MNVRGTRGHRPGSSVAGSASQKQAVSLRDAVVWRGLTRSLQLSSAYASLANELTRKELRSIGGYSLGRTIGTGKHNRFPLRRTRADAGLALLQALSERSSWVYTDSLTPESLSRSSPSRCRAHLPTLPRLCPFSRESYIIIDDYGISTFSPCTRSLRQNRLSTSCQSSAPAESCSTT